MLRSLIVVALLLLAPLATAQVYKWTDPNGTVHYSEAPPAQGTKYQKVKTNGSVEPLAAPAASSTAGNHEAPSDPANPVTDTPENHSKFCETLKSNITALQGSGPVVMQQNGKATALDDTQRKQQADTAQSQYNQYCQVK